MYLKKTEAFCLISMHCEAFLQFTLSENADSEKEDFSSKDNASKESKLIVKQLVSSIRPI